MAPLPGADGGAFGAALLGFWGPSEVLELVLEVPPKLGFGVAST
jgi:hypothetical protein